MNDLYKAQLLGLVRHLLTFGGGWLVAHGYATGPLSPDLLSGLAVFLVGVGWSLYQKLTVVHPVVKP